MSDEYESFIKRHWDWHARVFPADSWNDIPDPPMHFDRLGVAISLREWCALVEDPADYKRIDETFVGRWRISTIWLGINAIPWGPPQIFETMVFDADGAPGEDFEMRRYATEDQARQGHADMVQLVTELEDVQ